MQPIEKKWPIIRRTGAFLVTGICLMHSPVRSQVSWQTTHTSIAGGYNSGACQLDRGSLTVKVHQAYLEVEEDAEISPVGTVTTGNDPKTLELVGNFTMPSGATITGGILWDGDKILQGRLLDRHAADSLYDTLVNRNSTPPTVRPRDPLILESVGTDAYRFRIYPAEPGHSRHLRLSYQLAPVIGTEGLEIRLRTAIATLFDGSRQVPVTLQATPGTDSIILSTGQDIRTRMSLPRTRLMNISDLGPGGTTWDYYGGYVQLPGTRILAINPLRQVMVKTSFPSGNLAGNYLNLYTTVTDEVLKGLHQRVEVVVYWKWHNPNLWITHQPYGDQIEYSAYEAQAQAQAIGALYDMLGGPGTKIGLLHDDSKLKPHIFSVASKGDGDYQLAKDYLAQMQSGYVLDFVRGFKALPPKTLPPATKDISASKDNFLANLKLIKTIYSPETNTIRHLLMVSTGPEYVTDDFPMNASFDSLFADHPVSISGVAGTSFNQAGFDFWAARRANAYKGLTTPTPFGDLPGLPALNLNVIVKNASKSYDFSIACSGGLDLACGSLTFHGKSDAVWNDTLKWEAYDKDGKLLAQTQSVSKIVGNAQDTAVALLWAGSASPFSEKKELPLGPTFGFVDAWSSMLAMSKDSLANAKAYADSGVPHLAGANLKDILLNYTNDAASNPGSGISTESLGRLSDPSAWQVERFHGRFAQIRIPGLLAGVTVTVEVFDLMGKRVGAWTSRSQSGTLSWDVGDLPAGLYLLKLKVGNIQAVKRVAW